MCTITKVTLERYVSPFGIQHATPRISWRFHGGNGATNWMQAAYEIRVDGDVCGTFRAESSESVLVPWPFAPLASRSRARLHVRAFAQDGSSTDWFTISLETALLHRSDWTANVAHGPPPQSGVAKRPYILKASFCSAPGVARLYVTALGMYECQINGQQVGDHVLAPGWQSYKHRLHYQVFDVTPLLGSGANEFQAVIGEGWYAGRLGWGGGKRDIYGDDIGLIAQLEIDGQVVLQTGGEGWQWSYGELQTSEIYDGEVVDKRCGHSWKPAKSSPLPSTRLLSPEAPPVRRKHVFAPRQSTVSPTGKTIYDFGQNLVGWLRITNIPSNSTVRLRHAEVLENGELATRPLRDCKATDIITTADEAADWEPSFTFHGFRYAEVSGCSLAEGDIHAIAIYSDMEELGTFHCSHEGMTRFHENTVWGLRGNFVSIPTDCPQRDERMGWTGDIQVFASIASYLYDTLGLLSNWLEDLSHEQKENDGRPPLVVPDITWQKKTFAIWGDVTAMTPWDLYYAFGDKRVLQDQWESMTAWLSVIKRVENNLWDPTIQQLGDWIDPAAPEDQPDLTHSDNILVANAVLIHTTRTVAKIARILEHDASEYDCQADQMLQAFQDAYVTKTGRIVSDTQATIALALHYSLIQPQGVNEAARRLDFLVRKNAFRIATGFAGTPVVLPALYNNGFLQTAYRMFQEKQCPSLLYPISMGATTIWERWNSMLPDGTVNPGQMTSFNHYALGAVSRFLYECVGGLSLLEPGWRKVLVRPRPGGTVRHARTSHIGPYGEISCAWRIEEGKLEVDAVIPPNSIAKVVLPGVEEEVGSGEWHWTCEWVEDPAWPVRVLQPPPLRPQLIDEVVE